MKLIGAGFGRTGTMSLKVALEILGYGPCYHMMEVFNHQKNPNHLKIWDEAGQGKPVNWQELFKNYQSAVDWPASAFYRELMDVFPSAKVLLSVRDPQSWYESAMATIFRPHKNVNEAEIKTFERMTNNIIFKGIFQGRQTEREYAISVFLNNIEQVKQDVPPERLLVYEVRQGWEPLCQFLQVSVPDVPFPKTNSTEDFLERLSN